MTELNLGDKVVITGYGNKRTSLWEGREGVITTKASDKEYLIKFDDGQADVFSMGRFGVEYLVKIGPNLVKGDDVKIIGVHPNRDMTGKITQVKTFAAPETTGYVVELDNGLFLNGVKEKYVTKFERPEPPKKFAIGQRVRYTGDGNGVYEHLRGDGTVKGYTKSGNVEVSVDGNHIVHREFDLEAIPTEGQEIAQKDLKVGMEIRVEYVTKKGEFVQTSTKQGMITKLRPGFISDVWPMTTAEGIDYPLYFTGVSDATFTLIKDTAPVVDEVAALGTGSVVQYVSEGGTVVTYTRTSTPDVWIGIVNTAEPVKVGNVTVSKALSQPTGKILVTR